MSKEENKHMQKNFTKEDIPLSFSNAYLPPSSPCGKSPEREEGKESLPFGEVGGAIELRSEEVQEILTRPPHVLVRYGITLICSVLLVLFVGSFFFKYPDIVVGEVLITTENPPAWLVAKSSGRIKELLCHDKQNVNRGDLLAVIENSAATADMQKLCTLLPLVQISDSAFTIPGELLSSTYELGEVQSSFSAFVRAATNYTNFQSLNLINQEKSALERQITDRKPYAVNLQHQLELKRKELVIAKSTYEREVALYKSKVISLLDLETAEQAYLSQQQSLQQLQTTVTLENLETTQKKESLNKLSVQYAQEKNQLLSELKSAYRELVATAESWQQTYFLIAPQSGAVTFNSFWKQNQNISAGDKVFAIVSETPGRLIGKIKVPSTGSGKVKPEQTVNIKLEGYPYMEYGVLQSKIENISLVPNDNFYVAEVILGEQLLTSTKKDLGFTGELNGTAEVITEDRSIMDRIMSPLRYLTTKIF